MPKRAKVSECNVAMVYNMKNLEVAHKNARKDKAKYREVKAVDGDLKGHLEKLQELQKSGEFKTSEYNYFKKKDKNKIRDIAELPYFPDRIHHWALIQVIEPFLIRNLVSCTYSAIPGRGTFGAYKGVRSAISGDVKGTQWCMKIDISKYYASIDRSILKGTYERIIKDKKILEMLFEIIDSPKGDVGVPIGSYVSQYSGNVYLSKFDHYVKEQLHVRHYFRYMDDMIFFAATKKELQSLRVKIFDFLENVLHLHVKDNWALFYVDGQGVDFVGYVFKHGKVRLRKGIVKTIRLIYRKIMSRVNRGMLINNRLFCGFNSVVGWLVNCDGGGLFVKYVLPLVSYVDEYYDTVICKSLGKKRGDCKWSRYEGRYMIHRLTMLCII